MAKPQFAAQLSAVMSDTPAPIYIYQRVKQAIVRQIRTGAWAPHQRIPYESEMVAELGVSRMTINRALRELTSEGYLLRMQGVGTFVAEMKPQTEMLEVRNIANEIAARGHRHSSRLVSLQARPATADEAQALGIPPVSGCSTRSLSITKTTWRCSWKIAASTPSPRPITCSRISRASPPTST